MSGSLAFFGAFNPPTAAHIGTAECALRELGADEVIYVPSRTDYIAVDQGKTDNYSGSERLELLRAVAADHPWMRISDVDLRAPKQPRTYHSLQELAREGHPAKLLLGSDKLAQLSGGWRYVRRIAAEFGIVILARGSDDCRKIIAADALLTAISRYITIVDTPDTWRGISSTRVRELLHKQRTAAEDKELRDALPIEISERLIREAGK